MGFSWNESQKINKLPNGSVELTSRVGGLDEIKRWVLSFDPDCRVIEPAKRQEMVRKDLSRSLAHYSKGLTPEPYPALSTAFWDFGLETWNFKLAWHFVENKDSTPSTHENRYCPYL